MATSLAFEAAHVFPLGYECHWNENHFRPLDHKGAGYKWSNPFCVEWTTACSWLTYIYYLNSYVISISPDVWKSLIY